MHYVYILRDDDGDVYKGYSDNLKKRLQYHKSGDVQSTRKYKDLKLIWFCAFRDKKRALDFEKYLKEGSGHAFARKRLI
ncbi:hypothetical protein A3C18_02835 [Candidatus Kaiserbacteria bacterium RIFCSPHIGHO2_02_FULL_54_11b]|uniref:GIY-YIG domain-containing protein n=2 Tax=Candidatus Kaiseribacteriota TaxID=1752734 RepID=A0A1F6CR33_9BACT|nr:MAG: hypothetical protein A2704_04765 [Candidatus Kaiserbacteria bacterium RIFCSPHIGHO2_01_FULL_54_36b]OGG64340.1 MAG: hypothetical protein A3C18_02835 [Candidatus Kaiserbacteria bacterium RIFCSPHIGHO2_02_FULL_54_11b]